MINIKRATKTQVRKQKEYCVHNCAICKSPCPKAGKYLEKDEILARIPIIDITVAKPKSS